MTAADLRMAKVLFTCDISDRAGSNAPEIMGACERAASVLTHAGFGDVAAMRAERDAALADRDHLRALFAELKGVVMSEPAISTASVGTHYLYNLCLEADK